jgi:CHAD domain-containing protein
LDASSSRLLSKSYRNSVRRVRSTARDLEESSSPDNVHDLRTNIRRLEATLDLLPKEVRRRKKVKKYFASARRLFRTTTQLRDLDIIEHNVNSQVNSLKVRDAISFIRYQRLDLVKAAKEAVAAFLEIKPPKFSISDLDSGRISRRRDKIVKRLLSKLQEEVPIVLNDFAKFRELHDVRKDCKRLRYTLEIFPSGNNSELIEMMKQWQTALGNIRDIDVTEQFAKEQDILEDLEEVLITLRISRDKLLNTFRGTAQRQEHVLSAAIT